MVVAGEQGYLILAQWRVKFTLARRNFHFRPSAQWNIDLKGLFHIPEPG
jgi:hypothetical protein